MARCSSALAMCRQFQANRYSQPYRVAIAMWAASPAAFRGIGPSLIRCSANSSTSPLYRQYGHARKELQAPIGEQRISHSCFLNDELGHIQIESNPARFPPVASELLVGGDQQITARPGRQVTQNRCLDVDFGLDSDSDPLCRFPSIGLHQ